MGTSSSSKGPGKGVPLIPPWVPPFPDMPENPEEPLRPDQDEDPHDDTEDNTPSSGENFPPETELSPPRRFVGARLSFGKFAETGEEKYLRTGLGHYTRKGLGGPSQAAKRMSGTAGNAGRLFDVLHAMNNHSQEISPDLQSFIDALRDRPAREICDRIVELVRPTNGTLDAEASRSAIHNALRDLLTENPEVDLFSISRDQIEFIIERYIALDICARVQLDIGESVLKKAGFASGIPRLEEIKSYICEVVAARFRAFRDRGVRITEALASSFAARIIQNTFVVFEGWYE